MAVGMNSCPRFAIFWRVALVTAFFLYILK